MLYQQRKKKRLPTVASRNSLKTGSHKIDSRNGIFQKQQFNSHHVILQHQPPRVCAKETALVTCTNQLYWSVTLCSDWLGPAEVSRKWGHEHIKADALQRRHIVGVSYVRKRCSDLCARVVAAAASGWGKKRRRLRERLCIAVFVFFDV